MRFNASPQWRFCVAFATSGFLLSCGRQTATDSLDAIRARGVLTWGGDLQGGEPYVYDDPNHPGQLTGFEVDIANALARELGVRAQFVQQDWSNLVPSLERGSFDIALNGIEVTTSRRERVRFSVPYFVFGMDLVARRDDPTVTDLASLDGRRVGTLANSMSWERLAQTRAEIILYEGVEEPYTDLVHARTDAVLLDDIVANRYGLYRPELRRVSTIGDGAYAIAMRPGDRRLNQAIDGALSRIIASGELGRILERYELGNPRQERRNSFDVSYRPRVAATVSMHQVGLFLDGARVTIMVSALSMLLAASLGFLLALIRVYGPAPLRYLAVGYVELFRGTPVLLQLYVLYFGALPWFRATVGFTALNEWDALLAAILGLGLNYAAYEAEVYRAGIQAIPKGQTEAALTLGMSIPLLVRRIIVPQAFRFALPSVTNDFIALLKDSSLVSVITVVELTKRMTITAVEVRSWLVPGLLCAALYLAMGYPLSVAARRLEKKLNGGSER